MYLYTIAVWLIFAHYTVDHRHTPLVALVGLLVVVLPHLHLESHCHLQEEYQGELEALG